MTHHHPEPGILAEYAMGKLHAGATLVVACHIAHCAVCRHELRLWEDVAGAWLEDESSAPLSDHALSGVLALLDRPRAEISTPILPDYLARFDLPAPLRSQRIGRRRRLTPKIWFAPLVTSDTSTARTYLVYADRGTVLSEHTHVGREFTQVLAGAFSDDSGHFGAGDFACREDGVTHTPAVTAESECLCLISADASMRLTGWAARLIQTATGARY